MRPEAPADRPAAVEAVEAVEAASVSTPTGRRPGNRPPGSGSEVGSLMASGSKGAWPTGGRKLASAGRTRQSPAQMQHVRQMGANHRPEGKFFGPLLTFVGLKPKALGAVSDAAAIAMALRQLDVKLKVVWPFEVGPFDRVPWPDCSKHD